MYKKKTYIKMSKKKVVIYNNIKKNYILHKYFYIIHFKLYYYEISYLFLLNT